MNLRTVILSFCLAGLALARDKTDLMVMNNGDRLTCEVKGLDAGVLYVSLDYVDGTVLVDWSKVARLESNQLFFVKTQSGAVYKGTLNTLETALDRPVTIQVLKTFEQGVEIKQSQIVRMIATSENFWQRFSGEVSLGAIYSKGNQSTQYTFGSRTAYVRERWSANANFESNFSSSTGATVSTRNSLELDAIHLLPREKWFYSGLGGLLQSSEQGITLQSTLGGGIGRYLKNTDRTTILVVAGAAWQGTNYQRSNVTLSGQEIATALLRADARLFKFSKTNLDVTATLLPAVSDPGRIRFNLDASYYIKIFSNLKWNISLYGNWDNRPPPTGYSSSDYGSSSGLSWTFGLK